MFAEFPHSPQPQGLSTGHLCPQCRRPVATDQRYCLQCGHALAGDDRDALLASVGLGGDLGGRAGGADDATRHPSGDALAPAHATSSSGVVRAARRLSPGVATTVVGFMFATGIAVGAGTGPTRPPASATPTATQTAQARAAVLALLAARAATPAPAAAPVQAAATNSPVPAAAADATPVPAAPAAPEPVVAAPTTTPDASDSADATTPDDTQPTTPAAPAPLPNVTNAWVITLPAVSITALNATSAPASIVRDAITPQGVLLAGYTLASPTAPTNAVAAISGQPSSLATVPTIAAQLTDGGAIVRAYEQTAGAGCAGATTPADPRDPLLYFRAFSDDAACTDRVGDQARLAADLADASATPKLSWIPAPGDATAAAEYAANTIAAITQSAAYQAGGLILVLPDAPDPATTSDLTVGAVAISPFIPASTRNEATFGPYGVLRLLEDLFTLPALAGAGDEDVPQIDRRIFQTTAAGARTHHQPTRSSS